MVINNRYYCIRSLLETGSAMEAREKLKRNKDYIASLLDLKDPIITDKMLKFLLKDDICRILVSYITKVSLDGGDEFESELEEACKENGAEGGEEEKDVMDDNKHEQLGSSDDKTRKKKRQRPGTSGVVTTGIKRSYTATMILGGDQPSGASIELVARKAHVIFDALFDAFDPDSMASWQHTCHLLEHLAEEDMDAVLEQMIGELELDESDFASSSPSEASAASSVAFPRLPRRIPSSPQAALDRYMGALLRCCSEAPVMAFLLRIFECQGASQRMKWRFYKALSDWRFLVKVAEGITQPNSQSQVNPLPEKDPLHSDEDHVDDEHDLNGEQRHHIAHVEANAELFLAVVRRLRGDAVGGELLLQPLAHCPEVIDSLVTAAEGRTTEIICSSPSATSGPHRNSDGRTSDAVRTTSTERESASEAFPGSIIDTSTSPPRPPVATHLLQALGYRQRYAAARTLRILIKLSIPVRLPMPAGPGAGAGTFRPSFGGNNDGAQVAPRNQLRSVAVGVHRILHERLVSLIKVLASDEAGLQTLADTSPTKVARLPPLADVTNSLQLPLASTSVKEACEAAQAAPGIATARSMIAHPGRYRAPPITALRLEVVNLLADLVDTSEGDHNLSLQKREKAAHRVAVGEEEEDDEDEDEEPLGLCRHLDALPLELWRVLSALFFEYPHSDMFHCHFYRLFFSALHANHDVCLKHLIEECRFVDHLIDHSKHLASSVAARENSVHAPSVRLCSTGALEPLAGQTGHIIRFCNALRLQALLLPPSSFLRTFLRSCESWRLFLPELERISAEQNIRGNGCAIEGVNDDDDEDDDDDDEYGRHAAIYQHNPLYSGPHLTNIPDTSSIDVEQGGSMTCIEHGSHYASSLGFVDCKPWAGSGGGAKHFTTGDKTKHFRDSLSLPPGFSAALLDLGIDDEGAA